MNITRENLSDLELRIKVDIEEKDYQETVAKQLKDYHKKAIIPGFRKGMAPMSMIQRMYKPAVTADAVQDMLNRELFRYIGNEKLNILGMPLADEEENNKNNFEKEQNFTFYFDAAVAPEFEIDWSKVDVKYNQIKVTAKDVDNEMSNASNRYGKFETPETVGKGDIVYGKLVELDKKGEKKEDGVDVFVSLNLMNLKDEALLPIFEGKKVEEKIVFNMSKAFPTEDIERALRVDNATAKKFKSDVELTLSGISRIIPHEVNEELFERVFPGEGIKDEDAFRKAIQKGIEKANAEQSDYLYVNQVRKALIEAFDKPLPEAFLKRWFLSRGDEKLTKESLEEQWAENYVPSLKWELIEAKLENIKPVEPRDQQIVDYIKDILRGGMKPEEGKSEEEREKELENAARSIMSERENIRQIEDKLYAENLASLLKEQLKPTVEKVSAKEFGERAAL